MQKSRHWSRSPIRRWHGRLIWSHWSQLWGGVPAMGQFISSKRQYWAHVFRIPRFCLHLKLNFPQLSQSIGLVLGQRRKASDSPTRRIDNFIFCLKKTLNLSLIYNFWLAGSGNNRYFRIKRLTFIVQKCVQNINLWTNFVLKNKACRALVIHSQVVPRGIMRTPWCIHNART